MRRTSSAALSEAQLSGTTPLSKMKLSQTDLTDAPQKRAYNRALFDVVAPAYQRVTGLLSFGQDRRWKRRLVRWLPELQAPVCVDLACGTGDFPALLYGRYPDARVVGADLNRKMMGVAQEILDGRERAAYLASDMTALPVADSTADIVTAGYALRNAPELSLATVEIARILKPGGFAAILDFSRPPSRILSRIEVGLLGFWGRLWGRLFHGNPEVYGYIAKSLAHFPDRRRLTGELASVGLLTVRVARPLFGFLELRLVRKQSGHLLHVGEGQGAHGEVTGDESP